MINIHEAILADPNYFRKLPIGKSLLVHYTCPQIEKFADLVTDLNHVIYTVSGERSLSRGDVTINLTPGSLLFLRKGAFQQGRFHEEDWKVIVFCIHDDHIKDIIKKMIKQFSKSKSAKLTSQSMLQLNANETVHAYFNSLIPYFKQVPTPPQNLLELKMEELLLNLMIDPTNPMLITFLEHIGEEYKYDFVASMEANYMFNLSLEEFAKLNHCSLTAFKKKFSEVFSTTPGKWLLEKRLDLAYEKILTSSKSVNDVAAESGFESITHFSRVFKEKFGMSPLQCRKESAN